ncbi:polysaccharide biosynthesis/export family protein [Rheinheimera sp.]|uniref:polysaccharide biosynthesis/export family protein n=1 Tax=Rheinheimera sp. TaxID=1869214 RepID=UPI0040479171
MIISRVTKVCLLVLGFAATQQLAIAQINVGQTAQPQSTASPTRASTLGGAGETGLSLPGIAGRDLANERGPLDLQPARIEPRELDRNPLPPIGTTQFQSYVEGLSGKKVRLFGYNLFGSREFGAADNLPAPGDYLIGPGDTIELRVWGTVDMAQSLTVDRNGEVSIPKVGTVVVAGAKAKDLEVLLEKRIARVFKNFEVSATLGNLRSMTVYVVGQARVPGAHTVAGFSTLISALFETGGPSALGSMRDVQLVRDGKPVASVDLYDFIRRGDKSGDAPLRPGDVILIPPAGPRVALLGALDQPAVYELKQDEQSLKGLLSFGGGVNILTTPYKALIERIDSSNRTNPLAVREIKLDEAALKQPLVSGDVVTLLPIRQAFANAVTLRGNVAAPLRYSFTPGMRISDLIPEPAALITPDFYRRKNNIVQFEKEDIDNVEDKNLTEISDKDAVDDVRSLLEEINWDYAIVQRFDSKTVTSKLLPFNLGRAIKAKDPAHDLLLQSGDVVTIFGVKDVPVPVAKRQRYVEVRGEVGVPGIYEVAPGDTLDAVITRAGGFTPSAYLYGAVFVRESTRKLQQANLDAVKRRLQADVNNQSAQLAQNTKNALTGATDASAIQLQAQEKQRALDRIADLKASGRIALEMDPRRPELPDILLEDGDVLTIPVRPSFVAVYGAVYAETSFLHIPNKPVSEYIDQAGATANAELDGALVVRADGSVYANRAQRSWVGMGNSRFMSTTLQPGDAIFVPEEVDKRTGYTRFIEGAKDWTQLLYQFGIGAAAWKQLN